jgi:hypothetical protein
MTEDVASAPDAAERNKFAVDSKSPGKAQPFGLCGSLARRIRHIPSAS